MTAGTDTYLGMAQPLLGDFTQTQRTAATDMETKVGASGMTGKFANYTNSSGTTKYSVDASGNVVSAGDLQGATLTVTGIGTLDLAAQNAGTATFAVTGLTSNDVVILSPREATDGAIVVDMVAAGTLTIRNVASEAANVEMNYLVVSKA